MTWSVCCHSRQQAEQAKAQLAKWLEPRGLAFNEAKTRIVPVTEGFDFLGFNLRRYPNGKLLTKPGAMAIKRFRSRLAQEFRALRGANVAAVLATIVPIVRGWVAYYRTVVLSRVFAALTDYLWKLTCKWACWSHANKPKRWIAGRYFGKFSKFRNDRWVFGDKDTGVYLPKPSWTDIVRHTLVKSGASPDDPAQARYWAQRRQKVKPPLDSCTVRLLSRQDGRCSLCGENLLHPDQPPQSPQGWERWFLRVTRKAIKADYLVHHVGSGKHRVPFPGSPDTFQCGRGCPALFSYSLSSQARPVPYPVPHGPGAFAPKRAQVLRTLAIMSAAISISVSLPMRSHRSHVIWQFSPM